MKNLWTNIFGLILSFAFLAWGYVSIMAGIAQHHAGPIIGGYAFAIIGALTLGGFIADILINLFKS